MKKLFILLLLLTTTAQAAFIPTQPTMTIGGRVFTDLTNLITLECSASGLTNVNCTFRKAFSGSGYTPSGGTAFKCAAMRIQSDSTTALSGKVLYADNDVGFITSTAFTNPVYVNGNSSTVGSFLDAAQYLGQVMELGCNFIIPNGKYPGVISGGNQVLHVEMFGYEQ